MPVEFDLMQALVALSMTTMHMSESPSSAWALRVSYHLRPIPLAPLHRVRPALRPVWQAVQGRKFSTALQLGQAHMDALATEEKTAQASVYSAMAIAAWQLRKYHQATAFAQQSLWQWPQQGMAHRVLLAVWLTAQDYQRAYDHFVQQVQVIPQGTAWDVPFDLEEYHLILSNLAWHLGDWDRTIEHLKAAYPQGVVSMPQALQRECFRLMLYRNCPDEAVPIAARLLQHNAVEDNDMLIQALVQRGWIRQALTLYRRAYAMAPHNPLLRRRLVGLCLREGAVEEAQHLLREGALQIVA